ncbi:hypothetical protein ACFWPH_32745 [Nocardia sp. NPDC058499]|uniref:hypothetical protein n=1 Tax=Nocardia sp. NPDC058499 TaxID=3346530 RepID=UPI003651B387
MDPEIGGEGQLTMGSDRPLHSPDAVDNSLDAVLLHMILLGHDFEVLNPPELAQSCHVSARRLRTAATTPTCTGSRTCMSHAVFPACFYFITGDERTESL